jgi:hypothetical protein
VANEFTDLIKKIKDAASSDKNLRVSLSTTLAVHKPRIFATGFDAKNTKIGSYSTKPISISKKQQARQTGKTFFKGGYAEYKKAVGKNPGFVNFRNTDQMHADYGLIGSGGKYGFGFQNNENYKKSQWLESKYKKEIFDLTQKEIDVLSDTLIEQINKSL